MARNSNDALVNQMEQLLVKIETTRKSINHKDEEIARLKAGHERRSQLQSVPRESDSVQRLRLEVQQRQEELASLARMVHTKEMERDNQLRKFEQVKREVDSFSTQDQQEETEIERRRHDNAELQVQIRHTEKRIHLLDAQQKTLSDRLLEKQRQAQEAGERASQNRKREEEFGQKLSNLEALKGDYGQKEKILEELNEIVEQMDEALEMMESAVETAKLEHEVSSTTLARNGAYDDDFERSPQLKLWLGSAASSVATLKAVELGSKRSQHWVTADQAQMAQDDVAKRLGEADTVKQKLSHRRQQLAEEMSTIQSTLTDTLHDRDRHRLLRTELQETLNGDDVRALEAKIPEWQQKRAEAEAARDRTRVEWERVDKAARQKFSKAEMALEDQLKLLEWEARQTTAIKDDVRKLKQAELSRLQTSLEAEAQHLERQDNELNPQLAALMNDELDMHFNVPDGHTDEQMDKW
jgi:chromosome segregation ATPase